MKEKKETVQNIIQRVADKMCTDYCKHSARKWPEEDFLLNDERSPCRTCPLNELF